MNNNNEKKPSVSQDDEQKKFRKESALETTLYRFKHFFSLYIKTIDSKQYIFLFEKAKIAKNRTKQN